MVIFIALVALVNMGTGFALAVYLARQHRGSMLNAASQRAEGETDPMATPPGHPKEPGAKEVGQDPGPESVQSLREKVQHYNDDLTNVESRVLAEERSESEASPPQPNAQPAGGHPTVAAPPAPVLQDSLITV